MLLLLLSNCVFLGPFALASLKIAWGTHPVSNAKITNVHAGAENRTAFHLHPFCALCQYPFFGFHRFFPVFSGFCSYLVTFSVKIPRKYGFFTSSYPSSAARPDAAQSPVTFPDRPSQTQSQHQTDPSYQSLSLVSLLRLHNAHPDKSGNSKLIASYMKINLSPPR